MLGIVGAAIVILGLSHVFECTGTQGGCIQWGNRTLGLAMMILGGVLVVGASIIALAPAPAAIPTYRPVRVSILALLVILFGTLLLIAALFLTNYLTREQTLPPVAALTALLWIVGGEGLWRLRRWAWWLTAIASVIQILQAALQPFGPGWVGIGVGLFLLSYLIMVRKHFRIGVPAPVPMPQPPSM